MKHWINMLKPSFEALVVSVLSMQRSRCCGQRTRCTTPPRSTTWPPPCASQSSRDWAAGPSTSPWPWCCPPASLWSTWSSTSSTSSGEGQQFWHRYSDNYTQYSLPSRHWKCLIARDTFNQQLNGLCGQESKYCVSIDVTMCGCQDLSWYRASTSCTVLYCTVLYCTVLYCTVLYCTVSFVIFEI